MNEPSSKESTFLDQVTAVVERNISNDRFGVTELASEMNMSRSNLLRKVKKETKLSVSQLISQVRLKRAMEMLRKSALNVSEVSHQVGFNSPSYFIKCFREYYGFSPGEVGKRDADEISIVHNATPLRRRPPYFVLGSVALLISVAIGLFAYYTSLSGSPGFEKSIAVLPFKNDSNDSTNIYLINGLMESTLTNLQQIKDLRVISRHSVEKYRNTTKSIPEMARDLKVNYFVEGSGQKIGDRILLNIQLVEASSDRHLWAKQYRREAKDIFKLQEEVAKNIADEVQAIITPEEQRKIEKMPTKDPVAYDFFLKGKDLFYKSTRESLEASLPYFKKAIDHDDEFALAYGTAAMVYYYLDIFNLHKKYTNEINEYADKALSIDSRLGESLIAKGLTYAHRKEYASAIPYLEKALEYQSNAGLVVHFLSEFYSLYVSNPSKYLEYALMGAYLDSASYDSATAGFKYFHLSNAFFQAGFTDEAQHFVDKSLAYHQQSPYPVYVKTMLHYAKTKDPKQAREILIKDLNKDTTRFDLLQEVGKMSYLMRDYRSAYRYYKALINFREMMEVDIYKNENLKIGIVLSQMGFKEQSKQLIDSFKHYADRDSSGYKHWNLALYYSYRGEAQQALEHLKQFSKGDNFQYWILFYARDPAFDNVKRLQEFNNVMRGIEEKFWNKHNQIKTSLKKKELL